MRINADNTCCQMRGQRMTILLQLSHLEWTLLSGLNGQLSMTIVPLVLCNKWNYVQNFWATYLFNYITLCCENNLSPFFFYFPSGSSCQDGPTGSYQSHGSYRGKSAVLFTVFPSLSLPCITFCFWGIHLNCKCSTFSVINPNIPRTIW